MTNDLKERLRYGTVDPVTGEPLDPGVYAHVAHEDISASLAYITDLEARLVELNALNIDKMDVLDSVWKRRAEAAEAGEDAMAEALQRIKWQNVHPDTFPRIAAEALAAYEVRRG